MGFTLSLDDLNQFFLHILNFSNSNAKGPVGTQPLDGRVLKAMKNSLVMLQSPEFNDKSIDHIKNNCVVLNVGA